MLHMIPQTPSHPQSQNQIPRELLEFILKVLDSTPLLIICLSDRKFKLSLFCFCLSNRMEESVPVHKTPTYIVYESCLLELFETCPVCKRPSDVQPRTIGTFLSVEQKCQHCQYTRKWNSQPMLENTPAGNLQLSAAMYATGASFLNVEKVMDDDFIYVVHNLR